MGAPWPHKAVSVRVPIPTEMAPKHLRASGRARSAAGAAGGFISWTAPFPDEAGLQLVRIREIGPESGKGRSDSNKHLAGKTGGRFRELLLKEKSLLTGDLTQGTQRHPQHPGSAEKQSREGDPECPEKLPEAHTTTLNSCRICQQRDKGGDRGITGR